eukprot:sb/3462495/
MAGIDMGALSVDVYSDRNGGIYEEVWRVEGHQGSKWERAEIPLPALANVAIRWVGERGLGEKGDIAVDDIYFENCGVKTCDVEVGDRKSCGTPDIDGFGCLKAGCCYDYDTASCYQKKGVTDPVIVEAPKDFSGDESDTFSLYCRATSNPNPSYTWTRGSGAALDADRTTVKPDGTLQFTGASFYQSDKYTCTVDNGLTNVSTTATVSIRAGGANFDLDMSTWHNVHSGADKWDFKRYSGWGPNYWYGTGPSEDHTSGSGSYLLLDTAKPKKKGDNALFHSTWLMRDSASDGVNGGSDQCVLTYYYHMHGSSVGDLKTKVIGADMTTKVLNTLSGDQGYYMLFEASSLQPGTRAALIGSRYALTSKECKLVFFYHMAGIDMGALSVDVYSDRNGGVYEEVWRVEGHQGSKWERAEILLPALANVAIRWVGERGLGEKGDIAVDDIYFENCGVKTCDVEVGDRKSCGTPDIDGFGCLKAGCCYDYDTSSCYQKKGVTDPVIVEAPKDFSGDESDTFSLYCRATSNPNPSYTWTRGSGAALDVQRTTVKPDGTLQFTGASFYQSDKYTCTVDNGLTNVSATATVSIRAGGANFDLDMSTWHNVHSGADKWDFKRYSGWGPNYWYGTGPSEDHTSGSGSYLLLDTAKPKKKGDNALFHSTWLMKDSASDSVNDGADQCVLTYYYHMHGSSVGDLKTKVIGVDMATKVLNTLSGDQGNDSHSNYHAN